MLQTEKRRFLRAIIPHDYLQKMLHCHMHLSNLYTS
jgi:hypothetical protein